ncbi:MAG: aminotransferase class I/II-fold pyridoxal phosphate-dependent enzyme [Acidimicrobiaceae bacterium]|nr:aminotransferase class I/II-fold pyridoxal phosphate-dependent enzyme [Acidimicrobiaceae bacterium]
MRPSQPIAGMPRSGIREVMELANSIDGAIRLETGEPNFNTPRHVCEAASEAAFNGFTKYTSNAGIPPLREALAAKVTERNGINATADQVVVTSGAVAGIYSAMVSLVDPGAEMLLGDPSWPNYAQMMTLLKIAPVHFPLRSEADLVPQAADVEPLITERTQAILLNSPGNPTGAVTDAAAMAELMELARRHDLMVFSDEVYDEISFDGPYTPAAPLDTDGRVITFFSFSKTYAMTGWRVGYLVVPPGVSPLIVRAQEPITSCVNAPAQMGALAAVTGPQDCVAEMRDAYRHRRDLVTEFLTGRGIPHVRPRGAFYLMINVSRSGCSGMDFVARLLKEKQVAVVPGDTFGPGSGRFVRVSLATAPDLLMEGVSRLADAVDDWGG